jgi:hypothetical protein
MSRAGLYCHGFRSAQDVRRRGLYGIPGFGPTRTKPSRQDTRNTPARVRGRVRASAPVGHRIPGAGGPCHLAGVSATTRSITAGDGGRPELVTVTLSNTVFGLCDAPRPMTTKELPGTSWRSAV